jgi:uncharacterized membrane protein
MSLPLAFFASLLTFVVLDAAWLLLVGIGQFQAQLGLILRPQPDMMAAMAFYLIFAGGLVMLAIRPALQHRSPSIAAAHGAVLGLTAYATFDLTNLAVIEGWTVSLAALDMAWGTALSCVAAVAGYAAGRWAQPSA